MKEYEEDHAPKSQLRFMERGNYPDSMAYLAIAMQKRMSHPIDEVQESVYVVKYWYAGVFLLDRLPYELDYARVESRKEAANVHKLIDYMYRSSHYEPIRVPVLPLAERVQFILDYVLPKYPNFPIPTPVQPALPLSF